MIAFCDFPLVHSTPGTSAQLFIRPSIHSALCFLPTFTHSFTYSVVWSLFYRASHVGLVSMVVRRVPLTALHHPCPGRFIKQGSFYHLGNCQIVCRDPRANDGPGTKDSLLPSPFLFQRERECTHVRGGHGGGRANPSSLPAECRA